MTIDNLNSMAPTDPPKGPDLPGPRGKQTLRNVLEPEILHYPDYEAHTGYLAWQLGYCAKHHAIEGGVPDTLSRQ